MLPKNEVILEAKKLNNLQIVGKFQNRIILAFDEINNVLLGIDQHAIHERMRMNYFINYIYFNFDIKLLDIIDNDYQNIDKRIIFFKETDNEIFTH